MLVRRTIRTTFRDPESITYKEFDQMWQLYSAHHHVKFTEFKNRVLNGFHAFALFYQIDTRRIIGFVGLRQNLIDTETEGTVQAIYIGQTYLRPQYRGLPLIKNAIVWYALKSRLKKPGRKSYIWFDAISYKPFLMASRYSRHFYPDVEGKMPLHLQSLRNILGQKFYKDLYDPESGTVRKSHQRISDQDIQICKKDLGVPGIQRYIKLNPGYLRGDGLVCIYPNTLVNLLYSVYRTTHRYLSKTMKTASKSSAEFHTHLS